MKVEKKNTHTYTFIQRRLESLVCRRKTNTRNIWGEKLNHHMQTGFLSLMLLYRN